MVLPVLENHVFCTFRERFGDRRIFVRRLCVGGYPAGEGWDIVVAKEVHRGLLSSLCLFCKELQGAKVPHPDSTLRRWHKLIRYFT